MKNALSSVHGRFQPFHNGHLSYVLCALDLVQHVYVGVTRIDEEIGGSGSEGVRAGLHSEESANNPFSFFQRLRLIEAGLSSAGVPRDRFTVIPFPIEAIGRLDTFFPTAGTCFTTIKDEWNVKKIDLLTRHGFNVEVLDNVERHDLVYASGTQIRQWAKDGDLRWTEAVPQGVRDLLVDWDGRRLASSSAI